MVIGSIVVDGTVILGTLLVGIVLDNIGCIGTVVVGVGMNMCRNPYGVKLGFILGYLLYCNSSYMIM